MEKQQSQTPNLTGALANPKRIILANGTHYLSLSLFFFPLCATITSVMLTILNVNLLKGLIYSNLDQKTIIYVIIYTIFVYAITQCGIATITYSTHHRVLGNPLSLLTVIKSLKCTFFPLFFTSFVADILVVLIPLTFLVIHGLVLRLGQTLGFVNSYQNYGWFSLVVGVILAVILGVILAVILVKCSLACAVVVAEYKWGFSALKRSWHLVGDKGLRSSLKRSLCSYVILSGISILCAGVLFTVVYLIWSVNLKISALSYILLTVFGSFFLMMVLLMMTVGTSVRYNYHKAIHDELAVKIDQEYVHPPKDVKKVPQVVDVVVA